jgi:hypothetical protein
MYVGLVVYGGINSRYPNIPIDSFLKYTWIFIFKLISKILIMTKQIVYNYHHNNCKCYMSCYIKEAPNILIFATKYEGSKKYEGNIVVVNIEREVLRLHMIYRT